MNHQDIKDLLPFYALGGLDAESTTVIEQHLAEPCDGCVSELREWREVVGILPWGFTPDRPRVHVKERLMARVREDLGPALIPFPQRRWRPTWVVLPLAAAAAVLLTIGVLRYQQAVRNVEEQAAQAQAIAALLAQERERLASREAEIERLTAELHQQQATLAEQTQVVAQLEAALAEQRQLVALREQELARAQSVGEQRRTVVAAYEQEIAELKAETARQQKITASQEQNLRELRVALERQQSLAEARTREAQQLRDALARQRQVIGILATPGLQVGYLRRAKSGVDARGHVIWNERTKTWLFYAFDMPPPPVGKEYQVWFMTKREGPVSAGVFVPDQAGTGMVLARSPYRLFGEITAAAVTLEPAGGRPKPSGEMYLHGSL